MPEPTLIPTGWTLDGEHVAAASDEACKPRWRGIKGLDGDL